MVAAWGGLDVHLLASAIVERLRLWTADPRLSAASCRAWCRLTCFEIASLVPQRDHRIEPRRLVAGQIPKNIPPPPKPRMPSAAAHKATTPEAS